MIRMNDYIVRSNSCGFLMHYVFSWEEAEYSGKDKLVCVSHLFWYALELVFKALPLSWGEEIFLVS